MDCTENITGTLRAQMHSHQPLVYENHGISNQYVSDNKCIVDGPNLIRRLTPLECERLQGFPDGWTNIPSASDSARYKALGNSVAIPCVEFVMGGIALVLREGRRRRGWSVIIFFNFIKDVLEAKREC